MFWRVEVFESGQYVLLTDVVINGKADVFVAGFYDDCFQAHQYRDALNAKKCIHELAKEFLNSSTSEY